MIFEGQHEQIIITTIGFIRDPLINWQTKSSQRKIEKLGKECSAEDTSITCIWKNRKQKKLKNKYVATSIGTPFPSLMFCSVAGKSSINFKSWATVVGDLSGHPVTLYWSWIFDSSQESTARLSNWDLKSPTLSWKTFRMSPLRSPFISRLKGKCIKISNLYTVIFRELL